MTTITVQPTTERARSAASIRALAAKVGRDHPATHAAGHLRDAARSTERGMYASADRHLDAARRTLAAVNLQRHGVFTDEEHINGATNSGAIIRHQLRVHDLREMTERTAQRQTAMNAPAAATPLPARQPKEAATLSSQPRAISLVGPKGYVHGWRYVGAPGGHPADRVNMDPSSAPHLSDPELRDADEELARRAALLGKSGKFSAPHRAVKTELARRMRATVSTSHHDGDTFTHYQAPGGLLRAGVGLSTPSQEIDLSARTAMLERTPAPRGKPGGPGLYDVQGMEHSAYFQQIVKALIEKRGMAPERAYRIAWGALRKWRRGGGHVHPEVVAAASGALAAEAAKGATARAIHGHANTGQRAIELFNPNHGPTGQFTTPGGAGQGQGTAGRAARKKALLAQAAADRKKARALEAQLRALIAAGHHATASNRAATKAGRTGKTKSSTPAKRSATAAHRASTTMSTAARHGRIIALRAEIASLLTRARQAVAQAAKL